MPAGRVKPSTPSCNWIHLLHMTPRRTTVHNRYSGGIDRARAPRPATTTPMARAIARAPLVMRPACSRQEQARAAYGGGRGATSRWRRKWRPRGRGRRDAPAHCRHGRALPPPLAQSLPLYAGGARRRQSVGVRPRGGRAAAPTRVSRHARALRGEVRRWRGTGARLAARGGTHRIEAVRAGNEEDIE